MIAVTSYCCLRKYWVKQNVLPFHNTSNLKEIGIKNITMERNNKLKTTDIKNHTCYYFDDIVKVEDFDFENVSID